MITNLHIEATLLSPAYRQLKNLVSREKRDEVIEGLKSKLALLPEDRSIPTTRIDLTDDLLVMFADNSEDIAERSEVCEIENYLTASLPNTDFHRYWTEAGRLKYPCLSVLAFNLMTVPATNLSSEQIFNYAGLTANDRRSNLKSETLDKLLYLRSNFNTVKF